MNARDRRGFTPLYGAVVLVRPEAARLLLKHGADPHAENYVNGCSPMDMVDWHSGLGPTLGGAGGLAVRKEFEDVGHWAEERKAGTALWTVTSLMNHAARPRFVGRMMFVTALSNMRAGEELTISYSLDPERLKHWNIVDSE